MAYISTVENDWFLLSTLDESCCHVGLCFINYSIHHWYIRADRGRSSFQRMEGTTRNSSRVKRPGHIRVFLFKTVKKMQGKKGLVVLFFYKALPLYEIVMC